jgi:L-lactate dehydrogenase (cytochrome)
MAPPASELQINVRAARRPAHCRLDVILVRGHQWLPRNYNREITAMQATRMPSSKPPSRMSRLFASAPATYIEDLRVLAERRVPRMFYDYADSGSYAEGTYRANEADFAKIKLRQRIAVDISNRTLASSMVGQPVSMPVALAPTGLTGMQHADGEILAARAAAKAGVPFTLSTMSICSIEDVAENTNQPFWFQLYVIAIATLSIV